MKSDKILVAIKEVGKEGYFKLIDNTLETFQSIVGGYIETYRLTNDLLIILNEEGKLIELEPNFVIPCHNNQREIIVGNVAIVTTKDCEFEGLNKDHMDFLKAIGLTGNELKM